MSHIRIEMTAHGRGKVFVDDVELTRVAAVRFRGSVGQVNRVVLVLVPDKVTVTGPADVTKVP